MEIKAIKDRDLREAGNVKRTDLKKGNQVC